jgi:hypothetical protein
MTERQDTPTRATYGAFQRAYDFFNGALYDGRLPQCLITLQRGRRHYGYFSGNRWGTEAGAVTDEIALNPSYFREHGPEDVLSTLVHEMAHLWQHHFGTPGRGGYHNAEWAAEMLRVGLCPSNTGRPGGRMTGRGMSHYVLPRGSFEAACRELLTQGFAIEWTDLVPARDPGSGRAGVREKYVCPRCRLAAWAKPGAHLRCGACDEAMPASGF